jgi:hypothetical protein
MQTEVLPNHCGRVETILYCQNSLRKTPKKPACAEEQINIKQSAEQLDVQKNVLLNGFDSSTEIRAFLVPCCQKKFVAPFLVKKQKIRPLTRKQCEFLIHPTRIDFYIVPENQAQTLTQSLPHSLYKHPPGPVKIPSTQVYSEIVATH